jgi:transposase
MARVTEETREQVAQMHEAGMTVAQIAAELELSLATVYKLHTALGLTPNKKTPGEQPDMLETMSPQVAEEFAERYAGGEPAIRLITDYNITYAQMYTLLDMLGMEPRGKSSETKEAKAAALEHALHLYEHTDATIATITTETGVHQPVLHREIRARGIPLRRPQTASYVAPNAKVEEVGDEVEEEVVEA